MILSGVEPPAPGHAIFRDGWMGKKVFFLPRRGRRRAIAMRCGLRPATPSTLVLPALQEHQLQATSAQTRTPCVCAAAVCFPVLLLPRSCSRPCREPPKKTKCREVLLFRHHTAARITGVSLYGSSGAALPSADTLRQGPTSAPLKASGSKKVHRGPYQQA